MWKETKKETGECTSMELCLSCKHETLSYHYNKNKIQQEYVLTFGNHRRQISPEKQAHYRVYVYVDIQVCKI